MSAKGVGRMADWQTLVMVGVSVAAVGLLVMLARLQPLLGLLGMAMLAGLYGPGEGGEKISRVARAFGESAGSVGLTVAMASVAGGLMARSGVAERLARAMARWPGEKEGLLAMGGCGYVMGLAAPIECAFGLISPIARAFGRRTSGHIHTYTVTACVGAAAAQAVVAPAVGPLLAASILGVELGPMMAVGVLVGLGATLAGLGFGKVLERLAKRGKEEESDRTQEVRGRLPGLGWSVMTVVIPGVLMGGAAGLLAWADAEHAAQLRMDEVVDFRVLSAALREGRIEGTADPAATRLAVGFPGQVRGRLKIQAEAEAHRGDPRFSTSQMDPRHVIMGLNQVLSERAPGLSLSGKDLSRSRNAEVERANREVLERIFPESVLRRHEWSTPRRRLADRVGLVGHPVMAMGVGVGLAMVPMGGWRRRGLGQRGRVVREAGAAVLMASLGGGLGLLLEEAGLGRMIEMMGASWAGGRMEEGIAVMVLGFVMAAALKTAQGSSLAAVAGSAALVSAVMPAPERLGFHPAYLAAAIGSGTLCVPWLNDVGFWAVSSLGRLGPGRTLRMWTPAMACAGLGGLASSIALSWLLPLNG